MKIPCLWHEDKTPSLHIYDNGYYCFSCLKSGPLSDLGLQNARIEKKYKEDIESKIKWIKSLPIKAIRGLDMHTSDSAYFIMWPDNTYYIQRFFNHDTGPKYRTPSGHDRKPLIANLKSFNLAIVVEGEINALSIAKACPEFTVISPGSAGEFYSKKINKYLNYYTPYDRLIVIVDNDAAGAKACIEFSSILQNKPITNILWSMDANDVLTKHGSEALREKIYKALELPKGVYTDT